MLYNKSMHIFNERENIYIQGNILEVQDYFYILYI